MFIRKKANKGGTHSILLVSAERLSGKKHPVTRTIKNFGAASDEPTLQRLIQQAESYKHKLQKCSLKTSPLNIRNDAVLVSCRSINVGYADIYGQLFHKVFSPLKWKPGFVSQLQDLVVMRIAAPSSKRKAVELAPEFGLNLPGVDAIYKLMDHVTDDKIETIKQTVCNYTTHLLAEQDEAIDVLFYDLTTIYFETSTQDELRDFGFSKDGKHQHVQIVLAVIVTKYGLPIDYEEFPGNTFEGHTLLPVIKKIQSRYRIDNIVIVADSALMNRINLQELDNNNIKYIIAARIRNVSKELKERILDLTDYESISLTHDENGELQDEIKAKTILMPVTNDRLVVYHSTKRARKDRYDRERDLERIEKYLHSSAKSKLTGRLKKPYVKISHPGKLEIDQQKLKLTARFDGFFGLQTNTVELNARELLSQYRGLWQVEQTFRIAKTSLEIRPVFHYTPRRIRAHFAICYIALSLVRYVEFITRQNGAHYPHERFHMLLDRMRVVKITNFNHDEYQLLEDPQSRLRYFYSGNRW